MMDELLLAILGGFVAGALISKLSNRAKNKPVFKSEKIENSKDILDEARKAHDMGADSAAILLAFGAVELKLRERTNSDDSKFSIHQMLESLEQEQKLSKTTSLSIRQLAKIRNQTVHSPKESKKYAEAKVESYLKKVSDVLRELSTVNL
ncbi:hypothetical protein [Vibrio harveyi]|uniref:hypothetical protein n=1 Tax=Vibrio harveyi TaxID=669 RepID=UPI0012D815B5|nr:hypothetical protein [Vibrio harveyi]